MGGTSGGRPRKPTARKVLEGTFRKDRAHAEPQPAIADEVPAPPARLGPEPAAIWRRVAPQLHAMHLLTALDEDTLARYCLAEAEIDLARAELVKGGRIIQTPRGPQRSPWQVTLEHAMAEARQLAALLGLSPSARGRLDVEPRTSTPEEDDYTAFLAEGRAIREARPPADPRRRRPRS